MKKNNNRDYFYQDYQLGFQNPMMNQMPSPMMQSGYMMNNNYAAFGPNALPGQYQTEDEFNDKNYENRITKLERQIRKLEARVSKLENDSNIVENDDNLYII